MTDNLIEDTWAFVKARIAEYPSDPNISGKELTYQRNVIWDAVNIEFGNTQEVEYAVCHDIDPLLDKHHFKEGN